MYLAIGTHFSLDFCIKSITIISKHANAIHQHLFFVIKISSFFKNMVSQGKHVQLEPAKQ